MTQPQTQHKTYFDPHGYFFVSLPDSVYRRKLASRPNQLVDEQGNELIPLRGPSSRSELLSGVLTCRLICITPVHIGSGSYRHDPNVPGNVVADIVRDPDGNPLIPGSSLKGSFRAIAEAASRSCLLLRQTHYQEKQGELPDSVVDQMQRVAKRSGKPVPRNVDVQVRTDRLAPCNVPKDEKEHQRSGVWLCPCCALFGVRYWLSLGNYCLSVKHGGR